MKPILYSFRRCPYAMRARLALQASQTECELREIVLRNKPAEMLEASPKATVPVLAFPSGEVLEESLDIMLWSLQRNDPENWVAGEKEAMLSLIATIDGPFKKALDTYKYAPRPSRKTQLSNAELATTELSRSEGMSYLKMLDTRLLSQTYLFGEKFTLADAAIAPFVRQFAHVDLAWFNSQELPNLQDWLSRFKASDRFASIMKKLPPWESGTVGVDFGEHLKSK